MAVLNKNKGLEEKYEKILSKSAKKSKANGTVLSLPVKIKDHIIEKRIVSKRNKRKKVLSDVSKNKICLTDREKLQDSMDLCAVKSSRTVDLLALRENKIQMYRYKIGVLASEILESPHEKIQNISILLKLMDERNPEVCIVVKKLAIVSLLEIFKDILPLYNIKLLEDTGTKLKQDTLKLQKFEKFLLEYYRQYLKRLEKLASVLKKKNHAHDSKTPEVHLGILAINSLSALLKTRLYFNFSSNIAEYLIFFLDHSIRKIRSKMRRFFSFILQNDKCGELTLIIIRRLNNYIKSKENVHVEVIEILLDLQIHHQFETKLQYQNDSQNKKLKQQALNKLNNKKGKKKNKLKLVEKDLLAMKPEANILYKQKKLMEIMSLLCTIYFRILRKPQNISILSTCLKGLSKFSNDIDASYHQDIITRINNLLDGNLNVMDQLNCISTAFVMMEQLSTLNVDFIKFFSHFYGILFNIYLGMINDELKIVFKILTQIFINKHKNATKDRILAFIKRLSVVALTLGHNSALGILYTIQLMFQPFESQHSLFDTDSDGIDNIYMPELNDPDYCNARCTSLWEIVALQRHYHITVKRTAKNMNRESANKISSQIKIHKSSPEEVYEEFNPLKGTFDPNILIPKKKVRNTMKNFIFSFDNFTKNIRADDLYEQKYCNLYEELKNSKLET